MKTINQNDDICKCQMEAYEKECANFGRESLLNAIQTQMDDVSHLIGFIAINWKDNEEGISNRQALLVSLKESLAELTRYISYLKINWKEDNV